MKSIPLLAALSLAMGSPLALAKSELEMLRERCAEQDRQIRQLEIEIARLRDEPPPSRHHSVTRPNSVAAVGGLMTISTQVAAAPATYTVKAGDSFAKIARRFNTTPQAIAAANGLKVDAVIQPGQVLKLPGAAAAPAKAAPAPAAPAKSQAGTHKVEKGETFYSIAKKHGISTEALMAANPGIKPSALRLGQLLQLPGSAAAAPPASSPAPAPKPQPQTPPPAQAKETAKPVTNPPSPTPPAAEVAKAPAPQPPAPTPPPAPSASANKQAIRSVTIENEMTYGEFAAKHGTNSERLNDLNGLALSAGTVLAKGSELYVPAQP